MLIFHHFDPTVSQKSIILRYVICLLLKTGKSQTPVVGLVPQHTASKDLAKKISARQSSFYVVLVALTSSLTRLLDAPP
jgi:hypothetical protein